MSSRDPAGPDSRHSRSVLFPGIGPEGQRAIGSRSIVFVGIGAIAHLSLKLAPPAVVIRPMCHGPEKNIGWVPATNAGVMSKPAGTAFGESPSLKNES
jgi:hypothetical protein